MRSRSDVMEETEAVDVVNNANDVFTITERINLEKALTKKNAYKIKGDFLPKKSGKYKLRADIFYNDGESAYAETIITEVIKVSITGKIITPLPKLMALNDKAEITYTFANALTNIYKTEDIQLSIENLEPVTITIKKINGSGPTKTFNSLNDFNSSNGGLEAGDMITVTGTFTATTAGEKMGPEVILTYEEGEEVRFDNQNPDNITKVETVNVTGQVSPDLPSNIKLGETKPVVFIFTNPHATLPANVSSITITMEEI